MMDSLQEMQVSLKESDWDGKQAAASVEDLDSHVEVNLVEDAVVEENKSVCFENQRWCEADSIPRDDTHSLPERRDCDEEEDEDSDSGCVELEEEDLSRGERGLGALWRWSLCATLMFVAWTFIGGVSIECRNPLPDIRERDPVQRIIVTRRRRATQHEASGSTSP